MSLAGIVGHSRTVTLLRRLVAAGRLPHALVLEGAAGTGRRCLALALARAVLCPQQRDGDACGACDSCRLLAEGSHPDATVLPSDTERVELPVDMIRNEVVDPATESPLMGDHRVFIIPAAERLKGPAANALLKVLEEPPPGVHLIMTTGQAGGLLETIQSRAQVLRMQALTEEQLATILCKGGVAPAEAARRARIGDGSHRGLWSRTLDAPPITELRRLVLEGYDAETVSRVMDELPAVAADVPSGTTVNGEQRRLLGFWLESLLGELRRELRGERAVQAADRIERVLRLRGDLGRYVQPRLIVEGLGLEG
ncbi:MAG: hypothetical protein PF961_13845 [Planctomycetota bacterium]|jgi:DNA polymerase III delta' subunit|nr:hypothetical protein [Planctomycetota bacterium]